MTDVGPPDCPTIIFLFFFIIYALLLHLHDAFSGIIAESQQFLQYVFVISYIFSIFLTIYTAKMTDFLSKYHLHRHTPAQTASQ